MISTTSNQKTQRRLSVPLSTLGLLFLLATLPAYGQKLHQLFYNNSNWADSRPTGLFANAYTGIGALTTSPTNGLHTYYLSDVDEIHQAYNVGGGWQDENLTAETKAVPANSGTNVVGVSIQNFQYVFYIGADFDLHQLLYNNVGWVDTDLTQTYRLPSSNGTQVAAFVTTPNNALHVFYVTPGPHVIQAFNVGNGWQSEDLTAETGGPQPQGRTFAGFSIGNLQYVYYVAFEGDVHELYYNNSKWADEDLTALAKTVPSPEYPNGSLSAMVVPGTKKLRVYYVATNNHVIQLASTNNVTWTSTDLTKKTKAPLATSTNGSVAFATTPNNQIHVFYIAGSHINQLFLPTPSTVWQNIDLTAETHGSLANFWGEMAGFSIANEQYVYYLAH